MKPFDLIQAPLSGTHLIEAGAGTGKTYTITGLFLRLLLEKRLPVNRILVVTFTQAATEELRDRTRRKLLQAQQALVRGTSGDPAVDAVVRGQAEPAAALDLLEQALADFDRAAIFTIHGFCRRILLENTYETGALWDTELIGDQRRLVQTVAEDFWRRHFYQASPEWLGFALGKVRGPEDFAALLARCPGSDVRVLPSPQYSAPLAHLEDFRRGFQRLRTQWERYRLDVAELLKDPCLNGRIYGGTQQGPDGTCPRDAKVAALVNGMDRFTCPASFGVPLFPDLKKFTTAGILGATRKGQPSPEHPFLDLCDQVHGLGLAMETEMKARLIHLKGLFVETARQDLGESKRRLNIQSFDDLLSGVWRALEKPGGGALADAVRSRYGAALVDEFQDTDAIQYRIFSTLFSGEDSALFMIGDPKQAIYSFRGADVYTYLKAAGQAARRSTLTTNWRSARDLITAVNAVFSAHPAPFVIQDIRFDAAVAAPSAAPPDGAGSPLTLWYVNSETHGGGKPVGKTEAVKLISRAVALEIRRLTAPWNGGTDPPPGTPLPPGDIAVLVRTNDQAKQVKQDLSAAGVPSVLFHTGTVFDTPEAEEMTRLLGGILGSNHPRHLTAALATDMVGLPGHRFDRQDGDPADWDTLSAAFAAYHRMWRESGFIQMFHRFLADMRVWERFLAFADGERRMTNVLHLTEILHRASVDLGLTPSGLHKWLHHQPEPGGTVRDEEQLRLESDARAVKIVTVHKSKGLEYPVVFCPFAWEGSTLRDMDEVLLHDPACPYEGRYILDLGSTDLDLHQRMAQLDLLAENIRLLYVALTRARRRCYLVWGRINLSGTAAPAYLFHGGAKGGGDPVEDLDAGFRQKDDLALLADLELLSRRSEGTLQVVDLPQAVGPVRTAAFTEPETLTCRTFTGTIPRPWRIASYSFLVSDATDPHSGQTAPGRDTDAGGPVSVAGTEAPEQPDREGLDIFTFPGGARAGIFFHDLFERTDFVQVPGPGFSELVSDRLAAHGFEAHWQSAVERTVARVCKAPLRGAADAILRLGDVGMADQVNEMEFYHPLAPVTPEALQRVFAKHGGPGAVRGDFRSMGRLRFSPRAGFMKGFIDMVFVHQGRFYVVDWKSNILGRRVQDYDAAGLDHAMDAGLYRLQYHLYVLAVDLYLRRRLPGYRYQRHFGGVFYIFIRGVDPEAGPDCGVFQDRPSPELVDALGRCLVPGYR